MSLQQRLEEMHKEVLETMAPIVGMPVTDSAIIRLRYNPLLDLKGRTTPEDPVVIEVNIPKHDNHLNELDLKVTVAHETGHYFHYLANPSLATRNICIRDDDIIETLTEFFADLFSLVYFEHKQQLSSEVVSLYDQTSAFTYGLMTPDSRIRVCRELLHSPFREIDELRPMVKEALRQSNEIFKKEMDKEFKSYKRRRSYGPSQKLVLDCNGDVLF